MARTKLTTEEKFARAYARKLARQAIAKAALLENIAKMDRMWEITEQREAAEAAAAAEAAVEAVEVVAEVEVEVEHIENANANANANVTAEQEISYKTSPLAFWVGDYGQNKTVHPAFISLRFQENRHKTTK